MQRFVSYLFLPLLFIIFLSTGSDAGQQALSIGYGFAVLNNHQSTGHIEEGRNYDFVHATYLYEIPFHRKYSFIAEPFVAYINRPDPGVDAGFDLLLRWYPSDKGPTGLFFNLGAGTAYTSVSFHEQGTHLLGILVGGAGFRYRDYFVDTRFRHYSNGNTASPNRSVNALMISAGMYF